MSTVNRMGFPRLNDENLRNFDVEASLEFIWDALHDYQEFFNPDEFEQDWDNICTAMAWITEAIEEGTMVLMVEPEE